MAERLTINGFRYGLDTRRSELTSQPGSLVTANNGHINEGGEFEKRKAFTLFGTLPSGCFGLQETPTGLYTFGSKPPTSTSYNRTRAAGVATIGCFHRGQLVAGDVVTISGMGGAGVYNGTFIITAIPDKDHFSFALAGAEVLTADFGGTIVWPGTGQMPAGVTYQQLRQYLWWFAYQAAKNDYFGRSTTPQIDLSAYSEPLMLSVVHSCAYAGKTVVTATFAAQAPVPASTITFVDGAPLLEQSLGRQWAGGLANNGLYMADQLRFNFDHYFASDIVAFLLGDAANSDQLLGPAGLDFVATVTSNNSGLVTSSPLSSAIDAVDGVSAKATIFLKSGASGSIDTVVAPKIVNGDVSGTFSLISAPVTYATSLRNTAQKLVNAINTNTPTTGYSAILLPGSPGSFTTSASVPHGVAVVAPVSYGPTVNANNVVSNSTTILLSAATSGAGGTALNSPLSGGVFGSAAISPNVVLSFSATTWVADATWTATLTANNINYTIGSGNIESITPTFGMALGRKLYLIAGSTVYFSSVGDATKWEQQDTGAGYIPLVDIFSSPTNLVSMAVYQGKAALFSRWNIQIYNVNADPAQYVQSQSLQNIGTFAALSVQSLGDLDVLFLSDTGVRSLRVRDSSLNAYVVDVGSPIDGLIQANLIANTASNNAAACATVEPSSNRYWVCLNGTIYVLSFFPTIKIQAWSTYSPTYQTTNSIGLAFADVTATTSTATVTAGNLYYWTKGNGVSLTNGTQVLTANGFFLAQGTSVTATHVDGDVSPTRNGTIYLYTNITFSPSKFLVYAGQVYVYDATTRNIFLYGGTNNNTYDGCVATVELPWLDAKQPDINKLGERLAVAMSGIWQIEAGLDPQASTPTQVVVPYNLAATGDSSADSTFGRGSFPFSGMKGTHFKMLAYTSSAWQQAASLFAATPRYNKGEEQ